MKISRLAIISFWTIVVPGIIFSIISDSIRDYFLDYPLGIAVVVALLSFLGFLSWDRLSTKKREELLSQFELLKETHKLEPEDLGFQQIKPGELVKPGLRPYYDIYIPRTAIPFERRDEKVTSIDPSQIYTEEQLSSFLENSSGLLLIGGPTEGKTRTLFEIILKLPGFVVIKIRRGFELSDAALDLLKGRKIVWFVDDLHTLAEFSISPFSFNALLNRINNVASHCALVGTSRNADELAKFDFTSTSVREFYALFKLKLVLVRPDEEDIKNLKYALHETDTRTFPTLGAVCMRDHFDEMRVRFRRMEQLEKNCVLSLILLNKAFIYEMTQSRIHAILKDIFRHGESINGAMLLPALGRLKEDGFIISVAISGEIIPEAAYITGEEATYYYPTGTSPENRKPEDDMIPLSACLLKNKDFDGMNCLAISYYAADKKKTALDLWEQISTRSGELLGPQNNIVATALVNKGFVLGQLGNTDQATVCYDLVESRYKDSPEQAVRERLAHALYNKAVLLKQLGKPEQAVACYDLVEARYKDAPESAMREWVAISLVNKGVVLGQLAEFEKEIICYDLVEARYKDAPEPGICKRVADALFNKGTELERLGKPEHAIACYDLIEARYKDAPEPAMRQLVAKALFNKGVALEQLEMPDRAVACYDLVEARYKDAPEPFMREGVAKALFKKGFLLELGFPQFHGHIVKRVVDFQIVPG